MYFVIDLQFLEVCDRSSSLNVYRKCYLRRDLQFIIPILVDSVGICRLDIILEFNSVFENNEKGSWKLVFKISTQSSSVIGVILTDVTQNLSF